MLQIMFKNFKNDFMSLLCIVNSEYQMTQEFYNIADERETGGINLKSSCWFNKQGVTAYSACRTIHLLLPKKVEAVRDPQKSSVEEEVKGKCTYETLHIRYFKNPQSVCMGIW